MTETTMIKKLRLTAIEGLRIRGATNAEISRILAQHHEQGRVMFGLNPETKKPFTVAEIGRFVKTIESEWMETASQSVTAHRARQLAELADLKKQAWSLKKYDLILRILTHESSLTGTKAPTEHKVEQTGLSKHVVMTSNDPIEAAKIYQNLMRGD